MPVFHVIAMRRTSGAFLRRTGVLSRRRVVWICALAMAAMAVSGCFQQSNTYPIEVFTEMHYSQAHRPQEPPRQEAVRSAVAFASAGGPLVTLDVPAERTRPYDPAAARELYRVNCSVCHGMDGVGDGPAAKYITATNSIYAQQNEGTPYNPPANLIDLRSDRTEEAWFAVLNSGINVMPRFGALLSEEEIRDLVAYMFDAETGLGTHTTAAAR